MFGDSKCNLGASSPYVRVQHAGAKRRTDGRHSALGSDTVLHALARQLGPEGAKVPDLSQRHPRMSNKKFSRNTQHGRVGNRRIRQRPNTRQSRCCYSRFYSSVFPTIFIPPSCFLPAPGICFRGIFCDPCKAIHSPPQDYYSALGDQRNPPPSNPGQNYVSNKEK